jgi:hypothetical protein
VKEAMQGGCLMKALGILVYGTIVMGIFVLVYGCWVFWQVR